MIQRKGTAGWQAAKNSGITMLEVTIAIVVLLVGLGGFVRALLSSAQVSDQQFATSVAREAALAKIEELRNTPFDELFETYNSAPADDPDGHGTAPGSNFAVVGLEARKNDADGLAGEVLLPTPDGVQLREDGNQDELGMPRDLNGDGVIDAADHASDYAVLPVSVRVVWQSGRHLSVVQVATILGDYQ